jgi:hypothetical protein
MNSILDLFTVYSHEEIKLLVEHQSILTNKI